MSRRNEALEDWQSEFPIEDTYTKADGRTVEFSISAAETPTGFSLEARETAESRGERLGYMFRAFSPTSPWVALGELRQKLRRHLSTRYVRRDHMGLHLTHDRLEAVVDYSEDEGGVVLQVDGDALRIDELWTILSAHEGFEVTLEIKDF